jgi:hypothetical protein
MLARLELKGDLVKFRVVQQSSKQMLREHACPGFAREPLMLPTAAPARNENYFPF